MINKYLKAFCINVNMQQGTKDPLKKGLEASVQSDNNGLFLILCFVLK